MKGVDVASFQSGMDYQAAKGAGIDFVIVKVSDGSAYVNPLFHQQTNLAYGAGQLIGYYHFWRQAASDKQQAGHFWQQASAVWERGERVAIDIEQPDDDPTPLPPDTGERVYAMALEVERLSGVTPDLYMDRSIQQRFFTDPKFARFGLWLAAWQEERPPAPAPWTSIAIWQTSGGAVIPGIGWADTDDFDGTAADWASSKPSAEQPQQPPAPEPSTQTEWLTVYIDPLTSQTRMGINFGGEALRVEGYAIEDVGVTVVNAAGERFSRSIQGGKFGEWVKQ